jgi:NADPH:quinone reductase-like Zn-dependent oxidoreductase
MKAITYTRYGGPDVLSLTDLPMPEVGETDILVDVSAASVSTADWRLRAAAYPGGLMIPGRLFSGVFRPRKKVLGTDFAGRVVKVGARVTRFAEGDRVFGFSGFGAHAEYLAISADGPVARIPDALTDAEAAALPWGALSALVFLRDHGKVGPGTRVLVVGASGGVGAYAVQIAKAMGAHVTGLASAANLDFVRGLGADAALDYRTTDVSAASAQWDVVLDTVRPADFAAMRRVLRPGGRYIPLNFGVRDMLTAPFTGRGGAPRMITTVSGDSRETLKEIARMAAAGTLRPVIDSRFPLARAAEAHARVEGRNKRGAVLLEMTPMAALAAA